MRQQGLALLQPEKCSGEVLAITLLHTAALTAQFAHRVEKLLLFEGAKGLLHEIEQGVIGSRQDAGQDGRKRRQRCPTDRLQEFAVVRRRLELDDVVGAGRVFHGG